MANLQELGAIAEAAYQKRTDGPEQEEVWYAAEANFFLALAGIEVKKVPDWGTPQQMAVMLRERRRSSVGAE